MIYQMVNNESRAVALYLIKKPPLISTRYFYEYQLSAQQLTQQMVGEYLTLLQYYKRSKLSIAQKQTLFLD